VFFLYFVIGYFTARSLAYRWFNEWKIATEERNLLLAIVDKGLHDFQEAYPEFMKEGWKHEIPGNVPSGE
jgi:hypothetical protein